MKSYENTSQELAVQQVWKARNVILSAFQGCQEGWNHFLRNLPGASFAVGMESQKCDTVGISGVSGGLELEPFSPQPPRS